MSTVSTVRALTLANHHCDPFVDFTRAATLAVSRALAHYASAPIGTAAERTTTFTIAHHYVAELLNAGCTARYWPAREADGALQKALSIAGLLDGEAGDDFNALDLSALCEDFWIHVMAECAGEAPESGIFQVRKGGMA